MAQLKSTTITGSARVTDTLTTNTLQTDTIKVLSDSDSSTYGAGTDGQFIQSNGQKAYWGTPTPAQVGLGNAKIYSGTCSTAAATLQKDVTCPEFTEDELVPGAVVLVTFTNTNSGAVGSLTLKVGSSTAKPLKHLYNATPTSNIPGAGYLQAGQTYPFYYNGTNWVVWMEYNTNSNDTYMLYYSHPIAGPGGIQQYSLFMMLPDGRYASLTTTGGTGTSKTKTTAGFVPGKVFYANKSTATAENEALGNGQVYESRYGVNLTYSGNQGSTLTVNKPVYLVGELNNGLFYLANDWITQTIVTEQDQSYSPSTVYIYLGMAYSTSNIDLDAYNPMYHYVNGALREYTQDAQIAENVYWDQLDSTDKVNARAGLELGNAKIFYGVCSSDLVNEAVRVVVCPEFTSSDLVAGAIIYVKFTTSGRYGGAYADQKMNVNNTGDIQLYRQNNAHGATLFNTQCYANQLYEFYYDGTNWVCTMNTEPSIPAVPYAVCTSSGSVASKYLTFGSGVTYPSAINSNTHFPVFFSQANTYNGQVRIFFNGTGKTLKLNGTSTGSGNYSFPAGWYDMYYDGTYYYINTNGKLQGDITGTAAKATADGAGSTITTTYMKKSFIQCYHYTVTISSNTTCIANNDEFHTTDTLIIGPGATGDDQGDLYDQILAAKLDYYISHNTTTDKDELMLYVRGDLPTSPIPIVVVKIDGGLTVST